MVPIALAGDPRGCAGSTGEKEAEECAGGICKEIVSRRDGIMVEVTKSEGLKFAFRYLNGTIEDIKKKKEEYSGICGPGMPGVDCSPKGVRIWGLCDSVDICLTWDQFVKLRDQEEQLTLY